MSITKPSKLSPRSARIRRNIAGMGFLGLTLATVSGISMYQAEQYEDSVAGVIAAPTPVEAERLVAEGKTIFGYTATDEGIFRAETPAQFVSVEFVPVVGELPDSANS